MTVGFPSHTEQRLITKNISAKIVTRATGPNRNPAIVVKMCYPEISPVLAKLYNKCLAESCFPFCWKSSSVVPVLKNDGERFDPGKYCPISLLPITSKIFESFINDSLTKHLDIIGLFSDLRHGFRALQSTADILTVLSEHIYNLLMQVERLGILHFMSPRNLIRFGILDCSTS